MRLRARHFRSRRSKRQSHAPARLAFFPPSTSTISPLSGSGTIAIEAAEKAAILKLFYITVVDKLRRLSALGAGVPGSEFEQDILNPFKIHIRDLLQKRGVGIVGLRELLEIRGPRILLQDLDGEIPLRAVDFDPFGQGPDGSSKSLILLSRRRFSNDKRGMGKKEVAAKVHENIETQLHQVEIQRRGHESGPDNFSLEAGGDLGDPTQLNDGDIPVR